MMMMVVIGIMMMMKKINFFSGTMAIKKGRLRRQKLKESSCLLLGTHQGVGIGVSPKTKKKKQNNYRHKHGLFFVPDDRIRKIF